MNNLTLRNAMLAIAIAAAAGCGGRDIHTTDTGSDPDTVVPADNVAFDTTTGDIFNQDGPIARLQKSDLSVICPPTGTDTPPGFQNGETDIVMDVVVTAPKAEASSTLDRYFVAEATLSAATPWTGAAMTVKKDLGLPDFAVGDVLTVTVSHLEYYCLTQLTATAGSRLDSGAAFAPLEVEPSLIGSQDPATAEPYEGVLVRFKNVRVTNPNLGYGQFEITGGVIVKPSFGLTYQAVMDDGFDEITGVVDYSYGKYVVLPRSNDDLILEGGHTVDVIDPGDMIQPEDITYDLPEGVEPPTSIIAIQSAESSTACSTTTSIKTITEGLTFNDLVVISPKYVASTGKLDGYYVCQGLLDPLVPYSCLPMTIDVAATEKFAAGDIIDAQGKYIEYYCLSEISATSATKVGTTAVPAGLTIDPADLGSQAAETAEPLEGVLVTIEDVEIIETPTNGSDGKDHGAFKVTGDAIIGNDFDIEYMNAKTDGRAAGQKFLSITGVVAYTYGRYEIMPRTMDDLVFDGDPIIVEKDEPDVVVPDVSDTPYTIYDIQTGATSTGCTTDGFINVFTGGSFAPMIVTTPKFSASGSLDGYYVEDYPLATERTNHGIAIVAEKTLATNFVPGDIISVTDGSYYEYYCVSQLEIAAATKTGSDTAPAPIAMEAGFLENGGTGNPAETERYEGMLVTIPATTITAATSTDTKSWFEVGSGIHISNQFYISDFTPTAGTALSSVTGVVRYHFGKYRLTPRSAADIVVSTK